MMLASQKRHSMVVETLLLHGASANIQSKVSIHRVLLCLVGAVISPSLVQHQLDCIVCKRQYHVTIRSDQCMHPLWLLVYHVDLCTSVHMEKIRLYY